MYSTQAYLYQQINRILLIDTSGVGDVFKRRWSPVYAKKLTINKGVDNVLLFEFVNQDQKPVNITGSSFVFRLINRNGDSLLFAKEMVTLNATLGRVKVTITAEETNILPAELASYSVERFSGNLEEAVFVNAQAQARGDVDIFDSVLPAFIPSQTCTIPDIYGPPSYPNPVNAGNYPDWARNPNQSFNNNGYLNTEHYTSHVPSTGQSLTTFQLTMDHFTGNIKAQSATTYQSQFFDATEVHSFYDKTGTTYINVEGYHPLLRLSIDSWAGNINSSVATATATVVNGSVTSIAITNAGAGYLAPPLVSILGAGAGATAEAEITNGSVSAINVITGGSGYVISPINNLPAVVAITTGVITDIVYR
jgi:hypothetical protein